MAFNGLLDIQEPSVDSDKLSYEIFSILETKFLFGYDDQKLWIPRQVPETTDTTTLLPDRKTEENDSLSAAAKSNRRTRVCILTIDGGCGGMRGFLPGRSLAHLERALREKSDNPNARIADFFDLAAGTGAGGIFSTMLFATRDGSRPIFDADDAWRFLTEQGGKVFKPPGLGQSSGGFIQRIIGCGSGSGSRSGSGGSLEKWTREAFSVGNRELTLKDTVKPILIPCYDLSTTAPFVFSRADALQADSYNFRLWEVCCATSSEPGAFEPVRMGSVDGRTRCVAVDGGLTMSNPTAAAITHVLHNKRDFPHVRGMEDLLILSLGSGQVGGAGGHEYEQVKGWKAKDWARPVGRIAGDGSADMVDQAVAMAFGQCRNENYVRIQATERNVDAELTPNNVKKLIKVTEEMLKQRNVESVLFGGKRVTEYTNFEKIDWFAEELVLEHRRRNPGTAPVTDLKHAATSTR